MQRQYVKFKDPLKSWTQNTSFLGLFNPGRYCGYDTLAGLGGLSFAIKHSGSGVVVIDTDNTPQQPYGLLVTKQGVYIVDDSTIGPFSIASNAGNAYERYDAIVASHTYVNTAGDNPATYSVITGPFATASSGPIAPTLTDPNTQVLIGLLVISPGFTGAPGSGNIYWLPSNAPDTGDDRDAKLGRTNPFTRLNQWKQGSSVFAVAPGANLGNKYWLLPDDGNILTLEPPNPPDINTPHWECSGLKLKDTAQQNGTRIKLIINSRVKIVDRNIGTTPSDYPFVNGYRPIRLSGLYSNGQQLYSGTLKNTFTTQPDFTTAVLELELLNNEWVVLASRQLNPIAESLQLELNQSIPGMGIVYTKMKPYYLGPGNDNPLIQISAYNNPEDFYEEHMPSYRGLKLSYGNMLGGWETNVYGGMNFAKPKVYEDNLRAGHIEITRAGFIQASLNMGITLSWLHIPNTTAKLQLSLGTTFLGFVRRRNTVLDWADFFMVQKLDPSATANPPNPPNSAHLMTSESTFIGVNPLKMGGSCMIDVLPGDILFPTFMVKSSVAAGGDTTKPRVYWWNPTPGTNQMSLLYLGDMGLLGYNDGKTPYAGLGG